MRSVLSIDSVLCTIFIIIIIIIIIMFAPQKGAGKVQLVYTYMKSYGQKTYRLAS